MNRKRIIPIVVVVSALIISTLYFELFRRLGVDRNRIEGTGTIEVTEIEVSSKIAGRVHELPFDEGQAVKKNDLLVRLQYDELNAQRNSAQASLVNAQRNLTRIRNLFQSGSVSKKDLDNAEAAFSVARANVDQVSAAIDYAMIYSPISGVVLERNLEVGEMAFPGSAILTIADLSRPWIRIYVEESRLGQVKLNQKALISVDSFPGKRFNGTVVAISNKAEFTPKTIQTRDERVKLMYAVKIALDNSEDRLRPGMPADAVILVGEGK